MSTHKHFDKICCVVLVFTLLLTVLFVNGESFGITKASSVPGYENRLFITSSVHTIDIIMDNWDEFLADCRNEEYYFCSVIIDNEAYKNVAIRAKGNTSLTQVEAYGNDRYSFKIEFDHYDSSKTYYGLDKLCLNNIIQDNTYMKDYLTYQMMAQMGVASPLCSYVNITVNGEDWGLYLAVEGVEDSFLQRNYGNDYGELYKPDSTGMGGGRGNGEKFDIDKFLGDSESENTDTSSGTTQQVQQTPNNTSENNSNSVGQMQGNMTGGQKPDGMQGGTPPELPNGESPFNPGSGEMTNEQNPGGMQGGIPPELPNGESSFNSDTGEVPDGMMPPANNDRTQNGDNAASGNTPESGRPNRMPGGGMSSDDVLLKYIDDEPDSYSNIFDNAKTDINDSDKTRLIESLQKLSSGENLDTTVDIEAVIRYFVVHNFVLNFDSYTGSMIHNYYLYEKDGQMQMIPWDYNLAFGGFQSMGGATSLANYPIDYPVSGGSVEDRPMIAWIFANEEYTELYHRYFSEFISEWFDSGNFENMIDSISAMIAPYVEKDPTKFCTCEEFETGISTLKEFCLLRAESIEGQLNGTIGSTSETQKYETLIDAGDLQISDMGTMQNSMGGGMNRPNGDMQSQPGMNNHEGTGQSPSLDEDSSTSSQQTLTSSSDGTKNNTENGTFPQSPGGQMQGGTPPDFANGQNNVEQGDFRGQVQKNGSNNTPNNSGQMPPQGQDTTATSSWLVIGISVLILAFGLVFAFIFKRRR